MLGTNETPRVRNFFISNDLLSDDKNSDHLRAATRANINRHTQKANARSRRGRPWTSFYTLVVQVALLHVALHKCRDP